MNLKSVILAALIGFTFNLCGAVPPAEQLVSADTVLLLTLPDWSKASTAYAESPTGQLLRDPELKAFKDKFLTQLQTQTIAPLERELGVKLADYLDLLRGQISLAVTMKAPEGAAEPAFSWTLLIDTKDKSDQLKQRLADLKKRWTEANKPMKSDKIRDVEFTTLMFAPDDLAKTLRNALATVKDKETAGGKATNKVELTFGQSDSLLLMGNRPQDLEKILVRQSGGQTAVLAEQADFQNNQSVVRDAVGFGWLNLRPIISVLSKKAVEMGANAKAMNPMMPKPDRIFSALGLDGLRTLTASIRNAPEGELVQFFLNLPEANRKGIFKVLTFEPKNANPPAFVAADTAKFNRYRIDGQKAWAALEAMIAEASPELSSILQMGLTAAGKDKDPNFDLKKALIGNLGDDFIHYQKNPRGYTLAALNSPPSITLLGSPNAEQLALALKNVAGMIAAGSQIKDREFLGRKIYSLPMPSTPGAEDETPGEKQFNFAASGGYLALSTDTALLEEYLRSSENKPKPLDDSAGLKEASQKVGGMNTGFWGYENQSETVRTMMETLKKDPSFLERLSNLNPLAKPDGAGKEFKDWVDLSLLPPFEKIAKYFYFNVYAGASGPEGYNFKFFSPTPPTLKK